MNSSTSTTSSQPKEKTAFGLEDGRTMPAELAEFLQMDVNGAGLSENDDDDDDSYDERAELADLVAASVKSSRRPHSQGPAQAALHRRTAALTSASKGSGGIIRRLFGNRKSRQLMAVITLAFFILFLLIPSSSRSAKDASGLLLQAKGVPSSARFKCPAKIKLNYDALRTNATSMVDKKNFGSFIATFRDREMDHWGHTYSQVKKALTGWKSTKFAPYLSNNSTIYDASLGVGLNLIMTLELLKESNSLSNIIVCGNDVQKQKVDTAHALMDQLLPSVRGRYGRFCQADSTALHEFLPENSFDLVFASRIPPLANPLKFGGKQSDLDRKYHALCSSSAKRNSKQLKLAQDLQAEWYTKWITEMIRIAKPGSPVIVEQVSYPLCEAQFDFGGLPLSFWNSSTFTNLIQPGSLTMEMSKLFRKRYHVFMLKRDAKE